MFCPLLIVRPFSETRTRPAEADSLNCPRVARTLLDITTIDFALKGPVPNGYLTF